MDYNEQKSLILATISNYNWDKIKLFFKSLEISGFSGHTVLFIENIDSETKRILRDLSLRVTLIPFNRVGLENIISINDYRYHIYLRFLHKNKSRYNKVLLTDVRDVFFQTDPFKASWKEDCITVAKECQLISEQIHNTRWILSKFGYHIYCLLESKTIICSGTTFGPTELILNYLKEMTTTMFNNGYFYLSDQGVHNYLIHTEKVKPVVLSDNEKGPIITLALEADENIKVNTHNQILTRNGSVASIVHQYDRKPKLVHLFNEILP